VLATLIDADKAEYYAIGEGIFNAARDRS